MQESEQSSNEGRAKPHKRPYRERRWFQIIAAMVLLAIVVLILIFAGKRFGADDLPQFVTGNLINVLIFAAIVGQVLIYRNQRDIMQQQRQAMYGQLEIMDQGLRHNLEVSKIQFEDMQIQWKSMGSQIDAMNNQTGAMINQTNLMLLSLEETRKIVAQNERAVKAAEDNAATAKAVEAPYFGIIRISFTDLAVDRRVGLDVVFMNGGKTPAWHFYALPVLVLGDAPESDEYWHFRPVTENMASTFIPSGNGQTFQYTSDFIYTEERRKAVEGDLANLFVVITIDYTDHWKVRHPNHTFKCIWDRQATVFRDFETA